MGWWDDRVVPRVVDLTCSGAMADEWRDRACCAVSGTVLELGGGSGRNLPRYGADVERVLVVEPSDLAWQMAQGRIDDVACPVERVAPDAADLPLVDRSIDAVVSTWTLCTIPDLDGALAEVARVLRPGGALHLVEHSLSPRPRMARRQQRMQRWWGRVAGGCHVDRDIPRVLERAGYRVEGLHTEDAAGVSTPWSWFVAGRVIPPSC